LRDEGEFEVVGKRKCAVGRDVGGQVGGVEHRGETDVENRTDGVTRLPENFKLSVR